MTILRIRLALSALGLMLAVAAIASKSRPVTWMAIAILAASVTLRFLPRPPSRD